MKMVGISGVIAGAFFLMCTHSDGALVDFRRLCQSGQQSFGFRRDPWQTDAVHYCFMTRQRITDCHEIDAAGGFDCGTDFFLQGGLPGRRAQCCRIRGVRLSNCHMLSKKFSYQDGFDIMYVNRALRKLTSSPTETDPTTFQVELCDLERHDEE
uniref:Uncharacterized protein LOC111138399 n=1 Tax=Crassostrea virginica TaxID=6565 RepID=A0A8B8F1N1_CRAVI|nr:uncharacterized protein LOC111138399 [Crassostrea virginica]